MKESSWERLGQDRHGRPTQDLGLRAWTQGQQNSRGEARISAHGQWTQADLESLCFSGPSPVLPEDLAPENQACCLAPSRLPLEERPGNLPAWSLGRTPSAPGPQLHESKEHLARGLQGPPECGSSHAWDVLWSWGDQAWATVKLNFFELRSNPDPSY